MADKAEESWMNEPLDPAEQKAQGARTGTGKSKQSQKVELKPFPTPTITFCCLIKCEQLISLQLEKAFEEAFTWAGGRWVGVKVTTLPASCI